MTEYFGVTPLDALNSGLPQYAPGGGLRDARGWVAAVLHLSLDWHIAAGGLYARLMNDAADSPIVADRGNQNQWIYGASLIRAW